MADKITIKYPSGRLAVVEVHKYSDQGEAWITDTTGRQRWIPKHWILPK